MAKGKASKLSLRLTDEQLKVLKPLADMIGEVKVAGTIEDGNFNISFIACNAAFIACNAAFSVVNAKAVQR